MFFTKRPDTSAFVTREELAAILPWVTRAELCPQLDSAAIMIAESVLGLFDDAYALTRLSAVLLEAARETTSPAAAYLLERLQTALESDGRLPPSRT